MVPADRRAVVRALGAGLLATTSGCAAVGEIGRRVRGYEHRRDAPVEEVVGPWPTAAADAARTGAVDLPIPGRDADAREVTTIGRFVEAQPAVVGDRAFVGVDRREPPGAADEGPEQLGEERGQGGPFSGLIGIDLGADDVRDAIEWRVPGGGPTSPYTPTVRGRVVYSETGDGVRAVDAADGGRYWWTNAAEGAPVVDGEFCYTFGRETVVALDAVTGEVRWESGPLETVPQGLAVAGDAVVATTGAASDGGLYCFEAGDGTLRWSYDALGESYARAVLDGDHAYAVNTSGRLHAVSLADGTRTWEYEVEGPSYAQPAVEDAVYVTSSTGDTAAALDPATGEVRWEESVGVGGMSPPAVGAETLVFSVGVPSGMELAVVDPDSGDERWRWGVVDDGLQTVQPVVAEETIYVVAELRNRVQASLYALG